MILLFYLVFQTLADFILPDKPNPIIPYRNNQNAYSQYDFYISFTTLIPSNGELEIIFPDEYDSTKIVLKKDDVMITDLIQDDTCHIEITFSTTTVCATNVVMSGKKLTIYFGTTALNAGSYKIRIKYNQNPSNLGGKSTGYFQINTKKQGVPVDSNINFGTLGFATEFVRHSTTAEGQLLNDGSNLGGYVTNYNIVFTTTIDLAIASWFRAEIATGFDISSITCVLVDTLQDLKCTIENRRIYFGAIDAPLLKGQHKIKLKNVINPSASGYSAHFVFETLEPKVNTVIEYYLLDPVFIKPGQIINPSIAGAPLNKNLRIDYTVKFTPMNKIPYPGQIIYTFPNTYQLDPTCRIISGLTEISGSPITCTASGTTITIQGFDSFTPQEVTLKIFAINPPISKLYTPCTIKTYSKFGNPSLINYQPIDQNLDAGSIQISEIESPYFVAIDLYRQMVNLTLSQLGPIDIRLYPMPSKQLKLTSSATSYGEIFIQIPLWWRLQSQNWDGWNVVGATPTCNFGAEISELCKYYLQIFQFRTPKATNYLKYFADMGLAQCDLPISLANVIVTPIPGRWDFRVLSFNDGSYTTFDQVPLEQDLYTMEIAVDPFPTPTYVKCTSKDQVDQHTVCYASLKVGLPIPYEGAINFNMSTVNSTYESSSAWPNDLGFGLGNDAYLKIPCTVLINGQTQGYAGTLHPNVVCFAFSGGNTRLYALLQVRGFSAVLGTGTTMFIVIPDIKSCTAYDMQCFVTLTSAYTTELDVPYTLNILKSSVALVVQGSVSKDVSVAAPGNANELQDLTLAATFTAFIEICKTTTWTFSFTSTSAIQANRDHILIKMPRDRFPYNRVGATSNAGNVYLVDNYRFNQLYYFVICTNTRPAGAPTTVTLGNVRNAIDPTPGVITNLIFWVDQRRQRVITFPISSVWQDGGVLDPQFQILPKFTWFPANRVEAIDMDFDSWVIFQAQFSTCHIVPANGLIELQVQGGLQTQSSTCEVWQGVSSAPKGLGYTHQCNLVTINSQQYYHITLFDAIPVLSSIILSYRGKTVLTAVTMTPITIKTYFDAALRISVPNDASNVNDYYNDVANGILNGITVNGPKIFPTKLEWRPFIDYEQQSRQGTRGDFYMHIKSTYDIPKYTSNSNPRIIFTFNTTGINFPGGNAQPHCRVNGQLCRICTWTGSQIIMSMPLNIGMAAETDELVMLSSRGADGSATVNEGFDHVLAGRYKMRIDTSNTGSPTEFTYKLVDIPPPKFLAFWVWSSNKIGFDPAIPPDSLAAMSVYRIFFNNPSYIPPSDNPNPVRMVLMFHRVIWPTFDNGFEGDLGTGLPHRTDLPCIQVGFNILPTADKLKCRLFIGSYPNPTKVIITDFDAIPAGTNAEIHLPNIFNPNVTYQLTKVSLQAELIDILTGNTQLLLQNSYSLINGTFGRTKENPAFSQISIDVATVNRNDLDIQWPAAVNPIFAVDTIDTMTTFQVEFGCSNHQMGGGADLVLFEMPPTWELPYGLTTCSFASGGNTCYGYPAGPYIAFYLDSTVSKDSLITGTINMKTPPFKIIVAASDPPIKIYVFTRSKLVDIFQIQFTQVMQAIEVFPVVTCDSPYYSQITDYIITVDNPKNIPTTGAIELKFPSGLVPREKGCRNSVVEGSELSQTGLICQYDGINQAFVITGFPKFIGPGKIVIRVRMENPDNTVPISGSWEFNTWYEYETPFNKLVTYGTAVSPTLSAYVPIFYWDTPYRSRVRARTTDYGTLEFRIQLVNDLAIGSILYIKLPFLKIRCSQFLCLWDKTPWFDNHNDNFLTSEKCLFDSATNILSMYTPIATKIDKDIVWRVIIDTQNSVDGRRGFQLPTTGIYTFEVYTTDQKAIKKQLVPLIKYFTFFECYSLITNIGFKNMLSVQFKPSIAIASTGYLLIYIPTLSEEGAFLFNDDLLTGKADGDPINCYARSGFAAAANTNLLCTLIWGSQVLGTPVKIKVTGYGQTLDTATKFVLEIDEFRNPTIVGDDKHIEIRLESYNVGNTLLEQGFSYDFTLKHFAYSSPTLPAPVSSLKTLFDTSATFDFQINANYELDDQELYDYFVFEFPKPIYDKQPHTIQTKKGSTLWTSTVTQGNNWVIIKPTGKVNAVTALKFLNYNNPQLLPLTGVVCTGYAIKDRIVTAVYTYAAITDFVVGVITDTNSAFLVTPIDFDPLLIPFNTLLRVQITVVIPTKISQDTIFDLYPPTGFSVYDNCKNRVGSVMAFTKKDNLLCTTSTGTFNQSPFGNFVGRPQLTYSGMDSMIATQIQIFEIWIKTPAAAVSTAASITWNLKAWYDSTRTVQLFDGAVVGFAVQNYGSYKELSWQVKNPNTIRANTIAPFEFSIVLKTAATPTSQLVVTFPSSVALPASAILLCTIEVESTGLVHQFSYCYSSGSFVVTMLFPVSPATFAINTWFKICINSRGSGTSSGLSFTSSGIFTASLTMGADTGSVNYEILPSNKFSNANIKIINQVDAVLTTFLVSIQTTVQIPVDGSLVLQFPTKSVDGTVAYFSEDLTSTTQSNGALFSCYSSIAAMKVTRVDCRLYKSRGEVPKTEIVIQNFPANIPAGTTLQFAIEDIKIIYAASGASIPLSLYSADKGENKLEALVFYDWVSPVSTGTLTTGTMSPSVAVTSNNVQDAAAGFTFSAVNVGTIPATNKNLVRDIYFRFPPDSYDLTGLTLSNSGTVVCYTGATMQVIANYAIHTQVQSTASPCTGTGNQFKMNGSRNIYSALALPFIITVCSHRGCAYQGTGTPGSVAVAASSGAATVVADPTANRVFPYSTVNIKVTYAMILDLPAGSSVILWHTTDTFFAEKIQFINGGVTLVKTQRIINGANTEYWITFQSGYQRQSNSMQFLITGRLSGTIAAAPTVAYKIGFYTRYNNAPVTLDATFSSFQFVPQASVVAQDWTAKQNGDMQINAVPGISGGSSNDIYIHLRGFSSGSAPFKIDIYIDDVDIVGGCSVLWLDITIAVPPTCGLSTVGLITISTVPVEGSVDVVIFKLSSFKFSTAGVKAASAVVSDSSSSVVATFWGFVTIHPISASLWGNQFLHSTNQFGNNMLSITYTHGSNHDGLSGDLFIDILDNIQTPTSRKLLCTMSGVSYVDCEFVPQHRLGGTTTQVDGYKDTLYNRILITQFPIVSGTITIGIWFEDLYTTLASDSSTKLFNFGYYKRGVGNYEDYQFGENFFLKMDTPTVAIPTQTVTLALSGTAQSVQNLVTGSINSMNTMNTQFNAGDYLVIKLLNGYIISPNVINAQKSIQTPQIYFSASDTQISYNSLGMYKITLSNTNAATTLTFNNFEQPYLASTAISSTSTIAMVLVADSVTHNIKEQIIIQKSADVTPATLLSCSAKQINNQLFEVSFQLPSQFVAFNNIDCIPSACRQAIQISAPSTLSDVKSYQITSGQSAITYQRTPVYNAPMDLQTTANEFRLHGFSKITDVAPISLRFRKDTTLTGAQTFTISIVDKNGATITQMATCTASFTAASTAPSGTLQGVVKSQFGFNDYQDIYTAIVKATSGQLTFQISYTAAMAANGYVLISTTSLDLANFDLKQRLKCFFRFKQTQLAFYSPLNCVVDTTLLQIRVDYLPPAAANRIPASTLIELVIKYDQKSQPLMTMPTIAQDHKFKINFLSAADVLLLTGVLQASLFEKQSKNLIGQTFYDHANGFNDYILGFTTSMAIPGTAYIQLEFPLNKLNFASTLTTNYLKDLGTGISNGYKINCIDKLGNLGAAYQCNLYYGIDTFQNPYSFIRVSSFAALASGSPFKITFMKFKNPASTDLLMNFQLRIIDSAGVNYEYSPIMVAQYTLPAFATAATTSGTISISPATSSSAITYNYAITNTNQIQTITQSTIMLEYNLEIWGEDYTAFTAQINGVVADINPIDEKSVFISFPANQAASTSLNVKINTGLNNPAYHINVPHTVKAQFIDYQTKYSNQYNTATLTFTNTQNDIATIGTTTCTSDLLSDPLNVKHISFVLIYKIVVGNTIRVVLPTDYIITAGQYCVLINTVSSARQQISCSIVDAQTLLVLINAKIPASTSLKLSFQVQLPSTVGPFTYDIMFYADNTVTYPIQSTNKPSCTMSAFTSLICAMPYIKTPQILLQDGETGPLRLTFKATAATTSLWYYALIDNEWLTETLSFPVAATRYEVKCFWNNLAATFCRHIYTDLTKIQIWLPSSTNFAVDDVYTIFVELWRSQPLGALDFTYQWHDTATFDYKTTGIEDVNLKIYNDANTVTQTITQNVATQNYRFKEVLTPPKFINYFAVHQGTINTYTAITIKFKLVDSLLSNLGSDWGQLILKIPTMDDWDNTQPQFPDGIGRYALNNQEIDCLCVACPSYTISPYDPIAPIFKCYSYLGAQHRSAPVEIWINPQTNLAMNDEFEITIAKVKLPPTQYTYSKMTLLAYEYYQSTNTFRNYSEMVHDFTFQTIPDAFTTYTTVSPPTFTPNLVGEPATVIWQVNNPYQDILDYCHDRWVLSTEDVEMIFEHPYNPETGTVYSNGGLAPFNHILFTTATNHDVMIFKLAKWVTFRPRVVQTKSGTQTLNVQKLKNMPYMIPTGVHYEMRLFIDMGVRSFTQFDTFTTSPYNRLVLESVDPVAPPCLTLQPQTYELKFLPYNKIPKGGKMIFTFPNYDWTFSDAYCLLSPNLVDSGCDIISTSKTIIVQDWLNDYDPNLDGQISVKFDIINPSTAQTQIPFVWYSYWDQSQTWLIDGDTFFESNPKNQIIAGGALRVTLWDRYQHPYTICGGRTGPIRLRFILRTGNLVYPDDYIQLQMWYAFAPSMPNERIVCYFNDPNDFVLVNIKSHRCDWDNTAGGTLQIYVPEEIDLKVGHEWELVISTFASLQRDGWTVRSPSDLYWVTFSTSTTNDKGWFEAQIPGCPFSSNNFNCENIGWQASDPAGDPSWTIFNFTAQTMFNNIPTGDPSVPGHSRLRFDFLTHNELAQAWPKDLTNRMAVGEERKQLACNGLIKGGTKPLQAQGNPYIECQNILATGNAWNDTPSYVIGQYYEQIATGQLFHFQLADFRNGYVIGEFQHIKINMEVKQEDGTFYPQNEHYCWHAPAALLTYPTPGSTGASLTPSWTQVNMQQRYTYYTASIPSVLGIRDAVVFDYNYPYTLPSRGFCQQKFINANYSDGPEIPCTPQHFNHWFVFGNTLAQSNINYRESWNMMNPPFVYEHTNPDSRNTWNTLTPKSKLRIYIWRSHILIYNNSLPDQSPTTGRSYVVLQTTEAENPANHYVKYHLGIFLQTYTKYMKYIRVWAPSDYQDIRNCKINRGLTLKDPGNIADAISCTISQFTPASNGWLIEIENYAPYQGDGWMIVDLELKNPNAQQWAGSLYMKSYESKVNKTYVIDEVKQTGAQMWVGETITPPNLFRVFRNTISYENRRAQTDDYAEVHMRLIPRFGHPATTSTSNTQVEIWLPLAYDLANGGDAVCSISNDYHSDLDAVNCKITSDRKITLSTDDLKGLKTECSMIQVTTVNAIGGNGIKLPSTPQDDTFQVFIDSTDASGNVKREYNYNSAYAVPDPITSATDSQFSITSTIRECSQKTIIKVRFTAPLDIPAGYDTSTGNVDALSAPPIGTIKLKYNTKDSVNNGWSGFPLNLGQSSTNVLCQGFASIKGTLVCTLTASPMVSVDYPAIVEVRGFDYITAGDIIEIHFLEIQNGCQKNNNGKIELSAYKTKGDGTIIELIKDSQGYVPIYDNQYYNNLLQYYVVFTTCPPNSDVVVDPNVVGAYTKLTINNLDLNCTSSGYTSLTTGDQIILRFPPEFEFPAESNGALSAIWNTIQMTTTIYPATGDVYLTFPPGTAAQTGCANQLIISQLRGPAYAFTYTYSINIKIIRKGYRRVVCDITGLAAPNVAAPSTAAFTISSQFSGDVYVDNKFTFSPSYTIPAGSTIKIQLPTRGALNYNHVTSSSPQATCTSSDSTFLSTCSISNTYLIFTALKEIPSQTLLNINLNGAKNPSYFGLTIPTDYQLIIEHPNGYLINQQNFAPFTFYKMKNVGVIYMKMSNTNNFQTVTAAYTFVMQSSTYVPKNGLVILRMPKAWASVVTPSFSIAKLSASWTSNSLSYTYTVTQDANYYNLKINTLFPWEQGGSLTLLMLKLKNPAFNITEIFQAISQYDGVNLDQTDINDTSLTFSFLPSVPSMGVSNFTMSPGNAGEVSTYSMSMTPAETLVNGSSIQLQFPSNYPSALTKYDLSLQCLLTFANSSTITTPCSAANQKLTVSLESNLTQNETFTLSVVGIANPNVDSSATAVKGTIDVITADSNNNIITYTSNAAEISPTAAPQTMKLLSVQTDSTNLQVKANYTICIQTPLPIPLGAEVFMDFPSQFNLKSTSYDCFIGLNHNNVLLPYDNSTTSPQCENTNSMRRIVVKNHLKAYGGDINNPATLCYIFQNIENPISAGPADNFVVSIYNNETRDVMYQTFGTLSATNTLVYSQQGLVITVASIDPIPRHMTSPLIKVTLERSVSHTVTLVPSSLEFEFIPESLVFLPSNGPTMYFKIKAKNETNTLPIVGQKQFSWTKTESATAKFSAMADSFFQYIETPIANSLFMTISPKVFRVALGATSLPITLTLSQPASEDLIVTYVTQSPRQDDYITFQTETVIFPQGTTTQTLTYTTKPGAISGSIAFTIQGIYYNLYTVNDNVVNFEILQSDDKIPTIVNYYAVTTGRTNMYFRASVDESVTMYYYLTLKGNPKPTMEQIKNHTNMTKVFTRFGDNQSYVAPITTDYIYNDVYFDFQGLTEQTDYTLYFYATDLSGNNNIEVKTFNFTTLTKYQPADFSITLSNDVDIDKLISAFGLITGLPASSFQVLSSPKKYSIDGEQDPDVQQILGNLTTTYTFQILPDPTTGGLSPLQYIQLLQTYSDLLKQEIPEFVDTQNIYHTAKEIFEYPQEFKYTPILLNYTEESASFKVALRYTGNLYTLVLPAEQASPSSKQVSMGLNSTNQEIQPEWVFKTRFSYSNKTSSDDQKLNVEFTYTLLFDNSDYIVYMTADNSLPSNPDLMEDQQMQVIPFKTKREIVIIPNKYVYGYQLEIIVMILLLLH